MARGNGRLEWRMGVGDAHGWTLRVAKRGPSWLTPCTLTSLDYAKEVHHGTDSPQDLEQCIDNCQQCHEICLRTVLTYCLPKGGKHAEASHIRLMLDCAEICETSANFMIRGSDLHRLTCGACAEVCERCAEDCERMGDDETMRRCAETCRRCADSCNRMAGHAMAGAGAR